MQNAPANRLMLGRIMAAQEVFRERGPAIAYPFLVSLLQDNIITTRENRNGPVQFIVGDQFVVSWPQNAFSMVQQYEFYNTMLLVNKMYMLHRSQDSSAIVLNSVGLGDYLLSKIRELPIGSERQELVGVMVSLVTNGFFTIERIHALYPDVEATISHAKENGIEHRSILPFPHRNIAPFRDDRPLPPSLMNIPGLIISDTVSDYPPETDRAPDGFETSIVRKLGRGNCLYKPEFFRAHKHDMRGVVEERVTDAEIQTNRTITERIISIMNGSE